MNRVFFCKTNLKLLSVNNKIWKQFFFSSERRINTNIDDVFGIEDVKKEDVSGVYTGTVNCSKFITVQDSASDLKEKVFVTSYGNVRLDSDNKVRAHGQFDDDFDVEKFVAESSPAKEEKDDMNFIDSQYFLSDVVKGMGSEHDCSESKKDFNKICSNENQEEQNKSEKQTPTNVINPLSKALEDANFIDKQYFSTGDEKTTCNSDYSGREGLQVTESISPIQGSEKTMKLPQISNELKDANFIDRQYFLEEDTESKCSEVENQDSNNVKSDTFTYKSGKFNQTAKLKFNITEEWRDFVDRDSSGSKDDFKQNVLSGIQFANTSPLKNLEEIKLELPNVESEENVGEVSNATVDEEQQKMEESTNEVKIATNAFEYYQQLRQGVVEPQTEQLKKEISSLKIDTNTQSLDSQGFRTFKEQFVDYSKLRNEEIAWILKKNVLFDDCDILAINKPYGIVCHGNKHTATDPLLHELLPQLAAMVNAKQLYTVHRLDKEATGVLLLSRTQEMCSRLMAMFKNREIKKYYTVITRGVPYQREGIIDIPMDEARINNKERMTLRPDVEREYQRFIKPSSKAKRAVTNYRVKQESGSAALLEVFTETGVKHQIRCHLGFGLRTPILGDHKYSHLDKLAPQKLPSDMLTRLNVRQSKVRNIPLHLHCRLVVIPQLSSQGSNISIAAHLPSFFRKNANALRLLN